MPSRATTSTMPEPMRPQPTMPTVRMSLASTAPLRVELDVGAKPTIGGMKAPHHHRTAATLGIAAAGLSLGHWLAYALAAPGAHEREELLHAAGHGYLAFATQLAVLAGTLGLAGLFLARVRQRESEGSFARDVVLLGAVQAGAFV